MKTISFILLSTTLFFFSCDNTVQSNPAETAEISVSESQKQLRHVVLFNFKESATPENIKEIEKAFAELPNKINEIHAFEWGINNSPEGLDKGLTHCFLVTFLSEADRDIYLPHPAHQEFVNLVGPHVEDVTVVDYWTD